MANKLKIHQSFCSLLELSPKPKKPKRISHEIDLKYDLRNSDVAPAWADVVCIIGESFSNLVNDVNDNVLNKGGCDFLGYIHQYEDEFDISKSISLDDLLEEIDCEDEINCMHRKLNLGHKFLHERK
ncbi:hypothetical protein [Pseudoalteromonas maricaloris]|uniref:Uncharacterized protein n=1 Tax=Pseudoalteromonas maricaloris TaxID=184924 RepID=A0A8I2H5U5_9GAMM|nr:hypothetical protein [Pseudoalteromonas maricaloris]NLR21764.1 hypothetical protein [Pseudoalteromonas maricaloris]WOX28304.1 hypothetical protein R5H13_17000 [Pseudoalteromonas maricaloris]